MARTEEEIILSIRANYDEAIKGIASYNTKLDELQARQRALKEAVNDSKITEEEYQRAMAASKEQAKVYKEQVRILSKEIQNNVREERMRGDSLVALRSKLSNVTRAYDELSKAERNGAKGQELKKHIKEITDELKSAEGETDRFYRNVGNYENSIKSALGLNNNFANSIMGLKNLGGGNILEGATTSIKSFAGAIKGLLANPMFLSIAGIAGAGMAFKWWYDYNEGLIESTRLTREFTGLTGDALEDIRNSIQATSDMFGKDYTETLKAVDALMAQYHLSASEAVKIVNDGFVAGADLSGDFLSKIGQFAPAFHDAGIKADEMVAIISQTRSGIFSDGGLAAIQKGSAMIRQMSTQTQAALDGIGISAAQVEKDLQSGTKSTFDVLQEISGKLREMPQDSQAVGDVLKNVFGRTAANEGLQMIESLDTMSTKLEDVKKQTGEYGELQEKQLQADKELNDVMSALFDMSEQGFGSMIANVKILATKWLVSLIKGIINVINRIIDLYNDSMLVRSMVASITTNVKMLWTTVKLVCNLAIDAVKSVGRSLRGLALILEGILTLSLDKVKRGFGDLTSSIPKTFKEGWGDIKKAGQGYANAFVDGFNQTANGRLEHISISTGAADGVGGGEDVRPGGTGSGALKSSGSGGKGKTKAAKSNAQAAAQAARDAAERIKKENDAIKQAEDLMLQLVEKSYEQQRQVIIQSYDHKIQDIRTKLATEKNLTESAIKAMNQSIVALEKLKQRDLDKLSEENLRKEVEREQKRVEMYLAIVRKGTLDEYNLRVQQLTNEKDLAIAAAQASTDTEEQKEAMILAIRAKYANQIKALNDELTKAEVEEVRKRYEERLLEMQTGGEEAFPELAQLRLEMEMRKEILDGAQQMELETDEEFHRRKLQLEKEYQDSSRAYSEKNMEIKVAEAEAIGAVMSGLGDIAEQYSDTNQSLAKLAKVLAIGQIAVSTGVALAEGIKQAQSVPFPGNLAAIATTVATILANIAAAVKTVKSAKLATGGRVEGEGTETSDSIPAMLSDGESVMTARATRMFAPALSVMNQLGGGVAIPSREGDDVGMELFAQAMTDGLKNMPRPVVSVEEINRVGTNVEVIERRRSV